MPRSRRRNHSRTRSRSRSDSYDRDVKRRRLDSYDSPYHRGSFSNERAQRSRQHERGTSAERRYKRSHRRSPTSNNHRRQHRHRHHGGHGGHSHRHRDLIEQRDRRSYSSSQVSSLQQVSTLTTDIPAGSLKCIRNTIQLLPQQIKNFNFLFQVPSQCIMLHFSGNKWAMGNPVNV